jgi:hypothetical protein
MFWAPLQNQDSLVENSFKPENYNPAWQKILVTAGLIILPMALRGRASTVNNLDGTL